MSDLSDEEEEEVQPRSSRRITPEWLRDTYSASFRAVPGVHRGAQTVHDDDTIGSLAECWCGEPFDHDWPGKAQGRKHPKGSNVQETATIDRNSLRGYHSAIQDFILHEVRVNDLKFRKQANAILLYPPDGSQPITVYARNNDKQLRSLASWHQKHVESVLHPASKTVDKEAVRKVAAVLNDPVEHPEKPEPEPAPEPPAPPVVTPAETVEGWSQYFGSKGDPIEGMVTDGTKVKCSLCEDTDHPWSGAPTGVGGHRRTWHAPDSENYRRVAQTGNPQSRRKQRAFTPEDYVKSGQVRSIKNRQLKDVRAAIIAMCTALDWWPTNPNEPKRAPLPPGPDSMMEERDAAIKRAEDAEAKVALMRETLGL